MKRGGKPKKVFVAGNTFQGLNLSCLKKLKQYLENKEKVPLSQWSDPKFAALLPHPGKIL